MKKVLLTVLLFVWVVQPAVTQDKKQITFRQIFNGIFTTESVRNVNWMKDGRYYTALVSTEGDLELRKYNIITGEYELIVKSSELVNENRDHPLIIQDYQFSADETKVLIKTDVERIWRRSTRENYYVYDLKEKSLQKLTGSDKKQQYAQLSPKGGKAAFVIDNDLYWVNLETREESRITDDGEFNKIINGAADWVYEEEFGFAKAWFWSPDGSKIAVVGRADLDVVHGVESPRGWRVSLSPAR